MTKQTNTSNNKTREEYVWECQRCGRKDKSMFFGHATSRIAKDYCEGEVRRIRWNKAW